MNYLKQLLMKILNIKSPSRMILDEPSLNIKEYLKAIKTAYNAKNKKLNVQHNSYFAVWNPETDQGWIEYSRARWTIARIKIIDKILDRLNII